MEKHYSLYQPKSLLSRNWASLTNPQVGKCKKLTLFLPGEPQHVQKRKKKNKILQKVMFQLYIVKISDAMPVGMDQVAGKESISRQ